MPARVVVVHNERESLERLATALKLAGYDVAAYRDPMDALDALATPQRVELVITCVQFPPGKPNGIALALMAKHKRPAIKVLFFAPPTAEAAAAAAATHVGEFLPAPIDVPDVAATVGRLLQADG